MQANSQDLTPLCLLARKYETDKGGQHYRYGGGDSDTCHNYTPVYHSLFEENREVVRGVLEIGVHAGSSVRMWKEYFPNAQILGLDTNAACLRHAEDRIVVRIADQNDPHQLLLAMDGHECGFDIIVDDGSHVREHQITSLKTLLPYVAPGGYYIIEDLGRGGDETQFLSLFGAAHEIMGEERGSEFEVAVFKIEGGLGPKVQPYEWLFVVRRKS